jgi:3,4-dihydroxy 2-butanone 4-phosphate synthase/GTP cyclohydrolase II
LLFPDSTHAPHPTIASTAEIVTELKAGRMVILVDEEDRENEGDLVMAAEHITPEAINFMAKHGRGLICLTLTEARCKKLGLVQMAKNNKAQYGTAFTVSIEAAEGVTTGISAADRARTIQVAVARASTADDIVQPGTSSRLPPAKAACWSAPATPKPAATWLAWPDWSHPRSSAKS